jgi:hypothetical protein
METGAGGTEMPSCSGKLSWPECTQMVLLCTAKLLAYVHHVICQEHKVGAEGMRTRGERRE